MFKKAAIAALFFALAGCSDKLNLSTLNGTYTGKFYYSPPADTTLTVAEASVSFSDNTYSSQGNTNYIPAGGAGTLEILEDNLINFKDKNIWTANFDWGLILNGKYKYELKSDSLILTRYREPCDSCKFALSLYQYRLKRSY